MKKLITLFFVFTLCIISFAQFSGPYNIGTGETYTTLKSFCDAVNAGTVTGNITLNITSDITEPTNFGLGVNTSGYSITIKPSADVDRTITFTSTVDNTGPSGHFVIGNPTPTVAWTDANTIATNNVTIDGYASGFSTKRLKFTNASAATANARLITVVGACQNTVIKNCIFENKSTSATSPVCIVAVVRKGTVIDVAPINLTISNNIMTATASNVGMGMRITNSNTPTTKVTGFIFSNNIVTAKRRLLEINYTNGGNIYGNSFTTAPNGAAGTVTYGLWTSTGLADTFKIYKNKFLQSTTQETGAFGHRVISLASTASYDIYNNMFSGMEKTTASSVGLNLTYLFYSGISGKINHNTFYMPALTNASSTGYYNCINLSGNTAEINNNIFISDEATHTNPSFISAVPTPASNYNDFYIRPINANHKVVSTYTTLAAYQAANPTKDINSQSFDVTFIGPTDLHLACTFPSCNPLLLCVPVGISTDIDGDPRLSPPQGPYMGADEVYPLPVELTAFAAKVMGSSVSLSWRTESETNSYMFIVERFNNNVWTEVAEVPAAGNSNSPKDYSYSDKNLAAGQYQYRLKIIDVGGTYEYSNIIEADIMTPSEFSLSQNYPNPFNPSTQINYSLPFDTNVRLDIYSINGELVKTLVNESQSAGNYNVQFDASGLSSGTYIYRLIAKDFVQTKKMQLMK